MVLRPTGHISETFPQASLLALHGKKTKPNTTKVRIRQSKEMYHNTKQTQATKARFSRNLRYPAWKRSGSVLNGKDKQGRRLVRKNRKTEEKGTTGEVYDINKQTIHIAPKSKIESRAHYAPEPARPGLPANRLTISYRRVPNADIQTHTRATSASACDARRKAVHGHRHD